MEGARGGQPRIRIPPYIFSISLILQSTDIRIIMEESSSLGNNKGVQNSIDQLPDEVLISIVSLLPVKEAARTSVLARRWRSLWKNSRIIDFDGSEMVCKLKTRKKFLESERVNFVNLVNRVLNLHSSKTIDEFRVLFDLDSSNANDIDRWIRFAFAKRVKRLELNIVQNFSDWYEWQPYIFPNTSHPIERLRILPRGSTCESLVSLRLSQIRIIGEVLEFFISKCPFLEELQVENADNFENLTPSCQAIRLRHLAIINCHQFRRLEICSPKLVSLSSSGSYITMALKDASSLINLSFGASMPSGLSNNLLDSCGCLSRLETLTLQTTEMLEDEELEFPYLPKLKKLVLGIHGCCGRSLLCFTPLIDAAPLLHEMVLKLEWAASLIQRPARHPDKGRKHQCLKVFEVVGFADRAAAIEVALYMLENVASLERMIIRGKAVSGKDLGRVKASLLAKIEANA